MNTAFDSLTHKMQRAALGKTVDLVLSHAEKDPAKTVGQIVDLSKQFYGDSFSEDTYAHAKQTLTDPNSKWSKLIICMLKQLDPNVARTTALNLGYEAFFRGTKTIRENRVKYQCNIPWLILFDPTSACNMHCVGCWAGEYGHKNNLSFDDMDKIVTEGKEPIPLEIGAMERDPDQLRRVYETGRAVAQIQVDKIRAFLETAKAEAEE